MGTPPLPPARPSPDHASAFVAGGVYALLFLLGLLEGVIGSFQYSHGAAGTFPLGAVGFAILILVTCGLGGWAMQGMPGALLPAIGWFVAAFTLAMPNSGGSVIIANSTAGEWFLYGGSVCALVGVGSAFVTIARRPLAESKARAGGRAGNRRGWLRDRNSTANGDVPPA